MNIMNLKISPSRSARSIAARLPGLVVACGLLAFPAAAQQPVAIPLELQGNRLVIYVGVNGGAPYPYIFDTGSQIFETSQAVVSQTTTSGTLASGIVEQYTDSAFEYDVVTVPSVQFYAPGQAATPVYSTATIGGTAGYRLGSVTATQSGTGPWQPVTSTAFLGPYSGIFGAGSFTSTVSGSVTMGSIFGQATTTGWVVSANGPQPTVTLGLDAALRGAFATGTNAAVYEWMPGSQPFPVSGAASSQQNAVTMNLVVQSGTDTVSWSTPSLFDTGTPSNNLRPLAGTVAALDAAGALLTSGSSSYLAGGVSLVVTGTSGSFVYAPPVVPPPFLPFHYEFPVNTATNGTATSTFGIGFFLTNSVLFDLELGQIGVTTAVVQAADVPEIDPEGFARVAALFAAALAARRHAPRRRMPHALTPAPASACACAPETRAAPAARESRRSSPASRGPAPHAPPPRSPGRS